MNASHTRGDDFLRWLQQQAKVRDNEHFGGEARKVLAEMRRAARNHLYGTYDIGRVAPHIGAYLSYDDTMTNADEWLSVIGALYALSYANVPHIKDASLGQALNRLRKSENGNDSLDARFMAMLNSREENLPGHLRQLIGLLSAAQKNIGLDWCDLLRDVQQWDYSERIIQKKWLRHYYRANKSDAASPDKNQTANLQGDNNDEN